MEVEYWFTEEEVRRLNRQRVFPVPGPRVIFGMPVGLYAAMFLLHLRDDVAQERCECEYCRRYRQITPSTEEAP